jgi:VWFA-related protein
MSYMRLGVSVLVGLACVGSVAAQQGNSPTAPSTGVLLDVVVTQKSGGPVSGLEQQDFTVVDNKAPQTITSFKAVDGRQAPTEVIVVLDAVNIGYQDVAFQRQQVEKFLKADGGHLAYPTTIAVMTDKGPQVQQGFSTDGNQMSAALEQSSIGLRVIPQSTGIYGAEERLDISLGGLRQLVAGASAEPGRKIILWVSPGWPLLSGVAIQEQVTAKQEQQLFEDIIKFSRQLVDARVTLYSIDPLGTADVGMRTNYWQGFLKPVTKWTQAQRGNLALEVLATHSGGMALNSSNDLTAQLQKCVADLGAYYEIAYDPAQGDQPHQYHQIEVKVGKPGLKARTLEGYYAQP